MDMQLPHDIAERAELIFVQPVMFFRACATMTVSKVSIA